MSSPKGLSKLIVEIKLMIFLFLEKCNLVRTGSHDSYIQINNTHLDYCCKLGNYLFDTEYARQSIEDNTHYFGDHSSIEHEEAYKERKENIVLN